ncbi:MAG TPA: DUF1190 domain-containing protein [Magnetospirillaceae bacterium]|nr:DUF1190 domain-containing protein [Magnetospirillaceae bacterium]
MIRTGRMAVILAVSATAILCGCDDKQPQRRSQVGTPQGQQEQVVYRNLDACLAQAKDMDGVQACRDGYAQAMEKMAEAPKYETQSTCEDVYGPGNCVPRGSVVHEGGGWFIPYMMGYMIGGGFGRSTAYYPVYVDRGGTTYAGGYGTGPGASTVVANPGWHGGAPAAVRPSSSSVVRGGFGSTAMTSAAHTSGG